MSGAELPDSVSGATGGAPAAGSDTVSIGVMHLSGGSHTDPFGQPGMQFLDAGGGLNIDFVDLSSASSRPWEATASNAGPISFTVWHAGDAAPAPNGASVPAAGLDAAWDHVASSGMLAEFSIGLGAGLPGAAMQPDGAARTGSAHLGDPPVPPIGVPFNVSS